MRYCNSITIGKCFNLINSEPSFNINSQYSKNNCNINNRNSKKTHFYLKESLESRIISEDERTIRGRNMYSFESTDVYLNNLTIDNIKTEILKIHTLNLLTDDEIKYKFFKVFDNRD